MSLFMALFGHRMMSDLSPECVAKRTSVHALMASHACDKITRRANFRFRRRANHFYDSRHPVPEEGALAIVTERWDGMRWTQRHRARDGMAGRASRPVSGHRTC